VIIKAYYTEQDVSNRLKYLLNFFEALSELIAAIYLGALVRNGQLYKDFEITVADSLDMNRALGSPSFGGWQTLISVAAKYLRNIVCKTGEQEFPNRLTLTEAFSLVDYELINLLCDKSLVSSTKAALDVRNSQSHGGIISIDPVIQQNLITELDSQLVLIEPVLRRIFKRFRMVTVDRPILSGDIDKHSYTVNLINGSSAIFNKDNVSLDRGLLPDRVYMHEDDSSLALPLFPLIRFSTGPTTANNTLYFYNKTTGLETVWKAYQFTDEPTITLAFDISAELPSDS
jgi:hypothetical protein